MIVTTFEADGFRNLVGLRLRPHPRLNFIVGANGAGKSSLLEAVQCLATGVGFRSRRYRDHLAHEADEYVLRADLVDGIAGTTHRCGVRRGRDGTLDARLDFEPVGSFAEIARTVPVKVLTPDSHLLVQGAPDERRRFLDWGCFHADASFLPTWRRYRRALSQRNELLRDGASEGEIRAWDEALERDGTALDELRSAYLLDLARSVKNRTQSVDFPFHVKLESRSGWARGQSLGESLAKNLELHRRMRTTTDGPHRAELVVRVDGHTARDVLSRGQQKLLVYLMHLAQLDVLAGDVDGGEGTDGASPPGDRGTGAAAPHDRTGSRPPVHPIVLCDDLGSELDARAAERLLEALARTGSQVFVTGVTLPVDVPPDAPPGAPSGPPTDEVVRSLGPAAGVADASVPVLADAASGTTLNAAEVSDPPSPFAVFTLDGGRLRA